MKTYLFDIQNPDISLHFAVRYDTIGKIFHVIDSSRNSSVRPYIQSPFFHEQLQSVLDKEQHGILAEDRWQLFECSLWFYGNGEILHIYMEETKFETVSIAYHKSQYSEFDDWLQIIENR